MSAYALAVSKFRPVDRAGALTAVDAVIAVSLQDPRARIQGGLDGPELGYPKEAGDIHYTQLRSLFAELFGEVSRFYLHDAPAWPTQPAESVRPRVIGLNAAVMGMLWLE